MVAKRRFWRHGPVWSLVAAILAFSAAAHAQTAESTRAAARQLATEGVNNFEEGEYEAASEKLNRAFETIRAPSLGLWSARALVQCGKLVQASERYLEVVRLDPNNGDEAVQRAAQADAEREYRELQPRLPRVTLALFDIVPDRELTVTLDGARLPAALLRAQVPMDPGPHVIVAKQGDASATQAIDVKEGARINVSLPLRLPNGVSPVTPPAGGELTAPPEAPRALPTGVWWALGAAGAGALVGGVTGVMAWRTRADLSSHCPGDVCAPEYANDVRRLNVLRTMSTTSFVIGGVGLGTAGVLWLASPRPSGRAKGYVMPSIGLSHVALEGAF